MMEDNIMSTTNRAIVNLKSSEKVNMFLESNHLHKKDFAEMIGVTLSYVYNLIDETIPFSTRGTTIERIAAVMDVPPEEFSEYKIPQEPILIDESVEFINEKKKEKFSNTPAFLKAFPRKSRVDIVDFLRGARPLPLNWKELSLMAQVLDIRDEEIYPYWEARLEQLLQNSGFNTIANSGLMKAMFECARNYIYKK